MEDVLSLVEKSIPKIQEETNCYVILSYVKLIDKAIGQPPFSFESKVSFQSCLRLIFYLKLS